MIIKDITGFKMNVRAAVRGLWTGAFDFMSFQSNMTSAIYRGYNQAWNEGAAQCGFVPSDRTAAEQSKLDQTVQSDLGHVPGFADFIIKNSKANGGKLGKSMTRAKVWINRYNAVVTTAQTIACADKKYQWVLGGAIDHCGDCLYYNGRIHRASVWASVGAVPQSRVLECRGYNCQCSLVRSDNPATPGRPRRPSG